MFIGLLTEINKHGDDEGRFMNYSVKSDVEFSEPKL